MPLGVSFFPGNFARFIANPQGGVAQFLEGQGERVAASARESLSDPYIPGTTNPIPGPPKRRTGDLVSTVAVSRMVVSFGDPVVLVTASSFHGGLDYALELRILGYKFVDLKQL
jgi:hypothetical protein